MEDGNCSYFIGHEYSTEILSKNREIHSHIKQRIERFNNIKYPCFPKTYQQCGEKW